MMRIVIAEDQALVRDALARLLSLEPDMEVVDQVADGKTLLEVVAQRRPELCLIDIEMPIMNGLQAGSALHRQYPDLLVVMLTTFGKPGYLQQALEAGARGFLLKDRPVAELATQLRQIQAGKRIVDPELAVSALSEGSNPLSPREVEILQAAADYGPIGMVARSVSLSPGTVRNYLSLIIQKLGVSNRAQAIAKARSMGWL